MAQGAMTCGTTGKSLKKGLGKMRDEFGEKIKPAKVGRKAKQEEQELPRDNGYDASYDGKHDRWNGYDPTRYQEVIDRYEKIEAERRKKRAAEIDDKFKEKAQRKEEKRKLKEAKRKIKEKKLKAKLEASGSDNTDSDSDSDSDSDDSDSDDEDLKMGENQMLGSKFDNHEGGSKGIRTTVRNLRIREDTAKYLYNLDPSSAYYDPKTRSMRADPRPHIDAKDKLYAGDNMIKASGESLEFRESQLYAWEASQRGQNLTMEAAPSAALFMHKSFEDKRESSAEQEKRRVLDKYGDASKEAPDASLLFGQSEHYVEYARDGRVIKGADKVVPKTKYQEDILIGNHTKPWGSYFDRTTRRWGFACCHQTSRAAYCVEYVAPSITDSEAMPPPPAVAPAITHSDEEEDKKESKKEREKRKKKEEAKAEAESQARLKAALEKEDRKRRQQDDDDDDDDRKRKYNSMKSAEVTDEEMEAYKMKKIRSDDPMANFMK